jgi:hypothetical protein
MKFLYKGPEIYLSSYLVALKMSSFLLLDYWVLRQISSYLLQNNDLNRILIDSLLSCDVMVCIRG